MLRFAATASLLLVSAILVPVLTELVDMTHYVDKNGRTFPINTEFKYENVFRGPWSVEPSIWLENEDFRTPSHFGTHMDAPAHFLKGGWTIDQVPVERFMSPAVVVDYSERVKMNPNEELGVADLVKWEERNGRIPDKAIVLARSGWSQYYNEPDRYFGVKNPGLLNMSFPGISVQAADWLVANRNIYAVGVESLSIDQGNTTKFPTHVVLAKNDILMVENIGTGIARLPERGAVVLSVPMKNRGASGSPIRMLAVFGESVNMFQELLSGVEGRNAGLVVGLITLSAILVNFY